MLPQEASYRLRKSALEASVLSDKSLMTYEANVLGAKRSKKRLSREL